MVDIISPTAEIRRGKNKKEERKKPRDENIMSTSAMQGSHKNISGSINLSTTSTTITATGYWLKCYVSIDTK